MDDIEAYSNKKYYSRNNGYKMKRKLEYLYNSLKIL